MITAYFSRELGSWVRLEPCEDGEFSHVSGFPNKYAAIAGNRYVKLYSEPPLPSFLVEEKEVEKGLWDRNGMPSFLSETNEHSK